MPLVSTYAERERANGLIEAALRQKSIGRSCKRCGKRLPNKHKFGICEACFRGGWDI
jgi:ribosomal protein S14